MSESPQSRMAPEADRMLAWEDLSARRPAAAFQDTLRELIFEQGKFFDRMAVTGGLREPLTFFWLLLAGGILMSFPLALAQFALTAPDPMQVSAEVYNLHLLPPRATGFLTVLLPVTLCLAGMAMVIQGTIFHLGGKFFGARNWEGSVSIWCYARSAGLAPIVAAEAVACAVSIPAWLVTLVWPGGRPAVGAVAHWCLLVLGCVAGVCAIVLFVSAVIRGCIRAFRLPPEVGLAAAVAGLLLTLAIAAFLGTGFLRWGLLGGAVTTASSALILIVLALAHHFAARSVPPGSRPSGSS